MGETKVPVSPQRVVVLGSEELDSTVALGFRPVGAVVPTATDDFPAYVTFATGETRKVGTGEQPDLEAIAALKPDLILGSKHCQGALYDTLSHIAPTVFTETTGATWKEDLNVHAEALGKRTQAEQFLSYYEESLDEFKAAMGDRLGRTHVSVVRAWPNDIRTYLQASFIGMVIQDAGLPRPPAQDKEAVTAQVSTERLLDIDGDIIFLMSPIQKEAPKELTTHPLWPQLKAVQQGDIHLVADGVWGGGSGALAAILILNDLYRSLVNPGSCWCERGKI